MIYEAISVFSDAQLITTSAESEKALDFGDSTNNAAMIANPEYFVNQFGAGREYVWLIVKIAGTLTTGTSVQFSLVASTNTGLTSTTTETLYATEAISTADLNTLFSANMPVVCVPIPIKLITTSGMRYVGMYYTIVGTYDTASAVDAFLSLSPITSLTTQIKPS
jgi:hypothetical protein